MFFFYAENDTSSKARDGICQRELGSASVPAAVRLFHRLVILPVISISLTGWVTFPRLNAKPSIPKEKSPLTGLQLPPLKPVTRIPLPHLCKISAKDIPSHEAAASSPFKYGIRQGREMSSTVAGIPIFRE